MTLQSKVSASLGPSWDPDPFSGRRGSASQSGLGDGMEEWTAGNVFSSVTVLTSMAQGTIMAQDRLNEAI